jgi:hypothetical protein
MRRQRSIRAICILPKLSWKLGKMGVRYGYYKDISGNICGSWNGPGGHDHDYGANFPAGVVPGLSEFLLRRNVVIIIGRQNEYARQ